MSNLENNPNQSVLNSDYRSYHPQQSQPYTMLQQQQQQQPQQQQQQQPSAQQLRSTSIPQPQQQYQQFPQNYYPDQYQQYQQMLNTSGGSQPLQSQPYSYYNQQGQNQSQSGQPQAQTSDLYSGTGSGASAAAAGHRYTAYGAPYNSYSMYQQSVPQSSLLQPQPQHYLQLNPSAAASTGATFAANTSSNTPVQGENVSNSNSSSVGQYQPPGIRPRVTTTMWEDEKTLCYQVDANNVSVVRRADNNMINGTKLLNVAQMTRGRRDGILKSEKVRHVVKIGSMHLKGVWIPFERALAMAQREGIVDLLYPLFVRDIKRVIQTGVTPSSTSSATTKQLTAGTASTLPLTAASTNSLYYHQYPQYQTNGASGAGAAAATAASGTGVGTTGSVAQSQSPQNAATATVDGQQQTPQQPQQSQVYGYQQPYYAPNQYYQQPYNPNSNYSSYGAQPMYQGYYRQAQPAKSQAATAQTGAEPQDASADVKREIKKN